MDFYDRVPEIESQYDYKPMDENSNISDYKDWNLHHNYTGDGAVIWVKKPGWEVAIKSMAVIPIMAIGIIGNLLIICLILRLKSLRKSHINLFILNMAFADLLTTLFCPWMALVDNIYQNYELGPVFCKLEGFIKMLCLLSSVLSLITISFDRFIAIVYPFKRHLNRKVSYLIITSIWILAVVMSTPLAVWRQYRERPWLDYLEKWCPEEHVEFTKYYWLFLLLPLVYLPLFMMIIIYAMIIRHLDRYEKTLAINETPGRTKHRRAIIKMLFIYILTTIICWFPLNVIIYYRRFRYATSVLPAWYINVCFISQLFAAANSAINPIVMFRKTFGHLLPKLFGPKKKTNRVTPVDIAVIQQHLGIARPSLASDSYQKQMLANLSNGLQSNTTSFTKQILMKRVPEIFMRDDT